MEIFRKAIKPIFETYVNNPIYITNGSILIFLNFLGINKIEFDAIFKKELRKSFQSLNNEDFKIKIKPYQKLIEQFLRMNVFLVKTQDFEENKKLTSKISKDLLFYSYLSAESLHETFS